MISKQEILSVAKTAQLSPATIEKDYALSWVLYGVAKHPALSQWVFKGGTCLKKCYFETYRFSEDLDFTVPENSIYSSEEIKVALEEVAKTVYEESGIEFKVQEINVEESINKKNLKTFIAKITYEGPLGLPRKSLQRIKFDITNDEVIAENPVFRDVFNAYSDAPNPPAKVRCYSINEILAEKTRAIFERPGRARDIYDVVNISRNFRNDIDISKAKGCLKEKFKFKSLQEPSVDIIISKVDYDLLEANWNDQLRHQLQILPPVQSFYDDLKQSLSWWIEEIELEPALNTIRVPAGEEILPPVHFPEMQLPTIGVGRRDYAQTLTGGSAIHLDHIRFAARNRLCIEIIYHGVTRLVEPYSLRRPGTGNLLLYVYELMRGSVPVGQIKAYKVAEIVGTELTQQTFSPRYIVEL